MAESELDALIRVAQESGGASPATARLIRDHIASAPFLSNESATAHIAKRIRQRQWDGSATSTEYVRDLHAAVRAAVQLGVYKRRGGTLAVAVAPTNNSVPLSRLGTESRRLLVVIHSADRGRLITGYQVADLTEIDLPDDVVWLQ